MFSRAGGLTCLPSSEALFRVAAKKRTRRRRPVLTLKRRILVSWGESDRENEIWWIDGYIFANEGRQALKLWLIFWRVPWRPGTSSLGFFIASSGTSCLLSSPAQAFGWWTAKQKLFGGPRRDIQSFWLLIISYHCRTHRMIRISPTLVSKNKFGWHD